jgi:hypothetical protein
MGQSSILGPISLQGAKVKIVLWPFTRLPKPASEEESFFNGQMGFVGTTKRRQAQAAARCQKSPPKRIVTLGIERVLKH